MNSKCVYKLFVCLLFIIIIIGSYSFCVNRVCNRLDSYYENKNDFFNEEKVLKTNVELQNNILGKKSKNYNNALENIIYFYEKQWMFDKAEYWQREYLKNINDETEKAFACKDLSYFLQKQGKYTDAVDVLQKAKESYDSYIEKNNSKNYILFNWNLYFAVLFLKSKNIENAETSFNNAIQQDEELKDYTYYYILKDMVSGNYREALGKIEKEFVYNANEYKGRIFLGGQPFSIEKILSDEVYRNILRLFLLEIYKDNSAYYQNILEDVSYSQKELYGVYSPENLCNEYRSYILLNDKKQITNLKEISSKLVYFEGKNQQDRLLNISDFCEMN